MGGLDVGESEEFGGGSGFVIWLVVEDARRGVSEEVLVRRNQTGMEEEMEDSTPKE